MQSKITSQNENESNLDIKEDEHITHMWTPYTLHIHEGYKYIKEGVIFSILSNALYIIAYPILFILNKILYNFKIIGKENMRGINTGKITISNHIHNMDCTMVAITNAPQKTYFPALKSNFEIPVIRILITLLNAIPIPETRETKAEFFDTLNKLLDKNKTIHFYPEGSLWPYYEKIRPFKNGAFRLAVDNNVPIIPMVYKFKAPYGIRRYIKKKPFIELHILKPIYPDKDLESVEAVKKLKEECEKQMTWIKSF